MAASCRWQRRSARKLHLFVERAGAFLAAKAAHAVERLFAIPASPLRRQRLAAASRRRRGRRRHLGCAFGNTILYGFHALALSRKYIDFLKRRLLQRNISGMRIIKRCAARLEVV